jgi:hypothetical protein
MQGNRDLNARAITIQAEVLNPDLAVHRGLVVAVPEVEAVAEEDNNMMLHQ